MERLVDSLKILKLFFDDINRKHQNSIHDTLVSLSLDHVRCLWSGLQLFYEHEEQPFDVENVTNVEQSKFLYDLWCLHNYAIELKHLKIVPGDTRNLNTNGGVDMSDLTGLKTLEVKNICHTKLRGLEVLCYNLESLICSRCSFPSIETALLSCKQSTSKRHKTNEEGGPSRWERLRIFKLPNNNIKYIDQSIAFAKNLEVLDLSYNRIKSSPVSLECLPNLESLLLNYNCINTLNNIVSPIMSNLSQLSLSFNLLQSLAGLEGLTNLRELDVSHNLIIFPENIEQLKSLKKLETVEMAGNPICFHKNYRIAFILKLHPAVINQIFLDGKKLSKKEKKIFLSTLDSLANPIPVTSHDVMTESVISSNKKKKPRLISNIPDQTNFQDDEDFMLSGSFKERHDHAVHQPVDNIVEHFQDTHHKFQPQLQQSTQQSTQHSDYQNIPIEKQKVKQRTNKKVLALKTDQSDQVVDVNEENISIQLAKDPSDSVLLKVEAVIENDSTKHSIMDDKDKSSTSDFIRLTPNTEPLYSTVCKVKHLKTDDEPPSEYFDIDQFIPSTDNTISIISKSRPTLDECHSPTEHSSSPSSLDFLSFERTLTTSLEPEQCNKTSENYFSMYDDVVDERPRTDRPCPLTSTPATGDPPHREGQHLFGVPDEEKENMSKDLTYDERKFDACLLTSTTQSEIACVVRNHWLLFIEKHFLPDVKIREAFDLMALKKVSKVRRGPKDEGSFVRLQFDTLQKQRRERMLTVEGGEGVSKEFIHILSQFIKREKKKTLECLKCNQVFLDEDETPDLFTSVLQLKTKKALVASKEEQKCPECGSTMLIQSDKEPPSSVVTGEVAGGGGRAISSFFAKSFSKPDFTPFRDLLSKSFSSEMGIIDTSDNQASSPTLSGSFPRRKSVNTDQRKKGSIKFIDRGLIGKDEDVQFYVDEEGQEAA